jgi:hypothetical protein
VRECEKKSIKSFSFRGENYFTGTAGARLSICKSIEGVAKLALEAKFDNFDVGDFSSQIEIIDLD